MTNNLIKNILEFLNIDSVTGNTSLAESFILELSENLGLELIHNINGNIILKKKDLPASGLVFSGHYDTVPGHIKISKTDSHIFGRGSSDMKSAIICMLYATSLSENKTPVICINNDEETNSLGINSVKHLLKDYKYCVVGEPTELFLNPAHRGRALYEINIHGERMHASYSPENNAFYTLQNILEIIKKFKNHTHDFLGKETITPVNISSSPEAYNVTPENIKLILDRRKTFPVDSYIEDCKNIISFFVNNGVDSLDLRLYQGKKYHTLPYFCENKVFINAIETTLENQRLSTEHKPFIATCDAAFIGEYLDTVILGPGSLTEAHTKNEKIEISQIEKALNIYININKEIINGL